MEVKFKLDVDTPKGKVSAIRTVIGMGKIPYLERLEIVERILKEVVKPL